MQTITYKNQLYPDILREIASSPKKLFVIGKMAARPAVAIIGSRKPTNYGKQIAYQLATELARANLTIVSGLALGIDATAHYAAVEAGGHTIAVLSRD